MGMNQTGDRFVRIPEEHYEKLTGDIDQITEKVAALERAAMVHGAHPPFWRAGEVVEIRGVNFRVVDISEQRLILRPLGFTLNAENAP